MSLLFYKFNAFEKEDSIVFIENIKDGDIKEGMGFIYKKQGNYNYIATNYHVVESANELYVYDYNRKNKINAEVVNFDLFTDIAILKIDTKIKIKKVTISKNQIQKNQETFYYNFKKNNFEKGKILSLDNEVMLNGSYYNVGVINSQITQGNSGGPLFNLNNEVIGLIALKDKKTDNGFFIPIDYVMNIIEKIENDELYRPKLGAVFTNTSNLELINEYGFSIPNYDGIIILEFKENSILKENDFKLGDILTKINNKSINNVVMFQKELYSLELNDVIEIEFYRNNELMKVNVVLK